MRAEMIVRPRRWPWLALAATLLRLAAPPLRAPMAAVYGGDDFTPPPDPRWAPIATADIDAAWRLIEDNHPGAVPEVGDTVFRRRLEQAHAIALQRARTVTS